MTEGPQTQGDSDAEEIWVPLMEGLCHRGGGREMKPLPGTRGPDADFHFPVTLEATKHV